METLCRWTQLARPWSRRHGVVQSVTYVPAELDFEAADSSIVCYYSPNYLLQGH